MGERKRFFTFDILGFLGDIFDIYDQNFDIFDIQ